MNAESNLVLTVSEVGRLLGISRATAYTLAHTGAIPTLRLGRRLVVPRKALEDLLASAGQDNGKDDMGGDKR